MNVLIKKQEDEGFRLSCLY